LNERFDFSMAVKIQVEVFWVVTPCSVPQPRDALLQEVFELGVFHERNNRVVEVISVQGGRITGEIKFFDDGGYLTTTLHGATA